MHRKLILFDMDDTLVNFLDYYKVAFTETFKEVYGVHSELDEIDFAGKTIPNILREVGGLKGLDKDFIESKLDVALEIIAENFLKSIDKTEDIGARTVLPGARELLKELTDLGYPIGLLTGSTGKVGRNILKFTGLGKYFDVLTFGEESNTRAGLFKLTIKKAEKKLGIKLKSSDIVMIGDSVRDVECGKKFSAITIAIASGHHSYRDLENSKPDYILNSLKDYKKIVEIISQNNS